MFQLKSANNGVCADLDKVYSTHFLVNAKNMQKQRMKKNMMYLQ